ncbi:MAG TPA: BON domain-containing protein [Caldilineaceae bacterium]|nr:BON domain-containing protein [Caldilineaceae bacterium]
MSFVSRLFGARSKYDDGQIVSQAMKAIAADPLISDPSSIVITSQKGVITISGVVHKLQEKDRIEGVVRSALVNAGLKHERIINELRVPQLAS